MFEIADILAKDKGASRLINTIVLLALGVIWVISQVVVKRQREKAAQEAEEQRRRHDAEEAGRPADRPDDLPQPAQQAKPYPPMPTTKAQPIRPEPIPVSPPPARRQAPVPVFPEPLRVETAPAAPAPQPQVQAKSSARRQPRTAQEEITRLQSRLRKLEHLRADRLEMEASPEADTAAIESRLLSIRPATPGRAVAGKSFIAVDLSDRASARNAIIMHEIFSPPQALRDQDELWDTY